MATIRIPKDYEQPINKAIHNPSKEIRYTGFCGLNVPAYFKRIYPNDNWRFDISTLLQSSALEAPLMGRFKLRTMAFFEPYSNIYGWYDNNTRTSTENLLSKKHWTFTISSATTNVEYNPHDTHSDAAAGVTPGIPRGSLLDFIGVPPGYVPYGYSNSNPSLGDYVVINIDRVLAYLDVVRTYLCNNQEDNIPYYGYVSNGASYDLGIKYYSRALLDELFMDLRYQTNGGDISLVGTTATNRLVEYLNDCLVGPNAGLFFAMYEPDYYNNFLSSKVGVTKATVDTSGDSFSIHELYFQNSKQLLIDRFDLSGGTFSAWSKTVWGTRASRAADVPDIIGSTTTVIDPRNITAVANTYSNTSSQNTYTGELFGQINNAASTVNKKYKYILGSREDGILIIVQQLIPCVDYSEGFDIEILRTNFLDEYYPQFAQLGYQNVPKRIYSAMPPLNDDGIVINIDENNFKMDSSIAKQISWLDLMTDTNRVHGEFSNFGMYEYWVLKRRYTKYASAESSGNLRESSFALTSYIDPLDWQYPFAGQTIGDPNFFFQINLDIKALRPIGKRFMPAFKTN